VLLDDHRARKLAKAEGLEILGSVGPLETFYLLRYLTELRSLFQQLLAHNVYIDQRLLDRRLRSLDLPPLLGRLKASLHPPFHLADGLRFFLFFAHRARAAFLASSILSCGVRAAMRAFTPLPSAALPPFLPISLITLETRSRLMLLSYDE
jgi:hypothetical protein